MKVQLAVFVMVFARSGLMAAIGETVASTVQQIVVAGRNQGSEARAGTATPALGADREGDTS